MQRGALLRTAALALVFYGILGFFVAGAMVIVGRGTFEEVHRVRDALDSERGSLVQTLRAVAQTLSDSASATESFEQTIEGGRVSANTGSRLAFETSVAFRGLSRGLELQIMGIQPLAGLAPQFVETADQLEQLAIALGETRDSLAQNRVQVQRVGGDLQAMEVQVHALATSFDRVTGMVASREQLLPFQVAFYGACLLFALQSLFSLIAGLALARQQRLMVRRTQTLLPRQEEELAL